MKKLLVACVAFCGYVVSAGAADLPVFAPQPRLVRPPYSWSGCHIGGNIGGGKAPTSVHDTSGRYGPPGANLSTQDVPGVAGGGQAGCDYQIGPLVFGIRGLYDLTGMNDETLLPSGGVLWNFTDVKWIATATGRIGFTVQPTMLLYLNAGAAWSRTVFDIATLTGITNATGSHTPAGWTVGGGFEWAFFADNWSAFLEFDYLDFGSSRASFASGIAPAVTFPVDISQKVYVFLFGINYRFFGGARF